MVNKIRNVRKRRENYKLFVSWVGFEEEKDETWDSFAQKLKDIPGIPEDFLKSAENKK